MLALDFAYYANIPGVGHSPLFTAPSRSSFLNGSDTGGYSINPQKFVKYDRNGEFPPSDTMRIPEKRGLLVTIN